MKKLSFVIPTINRFEYLETCLNSLNNTIKPDNVFIHLTIIDDNSDDKNVIQFIEKYLPNFADKIDKVYKTERTLGLCETNLKEIWSKHYLQGYELFCNIDPDAIVNKNWLIHIIELYNIVKPKNLYPIITPFHTHSHGIHSSCKDFITKTSTGGICWLFDRETYTFIIEKNLYPSSAWDWNVCSEMQKHNQLFFCTPNSYIEHIGKMSSARDSNLIPLFDKAINFIA